MRETGRENSKTLFCKECSLGSKGEGGGGGRRERENSNSETLFTRIVV